MKYSEMIKKGYQQAHDDLKKAESLQVYLEDIIGESIDEWIEDNYEDKSAYPLNVIHMAIQMVADRLKEGLKK
jgi:predicted house-cleaning noncanonical NTP pyrophosphatase (MazG superfamily)